MDILMSRSTWMCVSDPPLQHLKVIAWMMRLKT